MRSAERNKAPKAPRRVGSGEEVSPSPVGVGFGEGMCPAPRNFCKMHVEFTNFAAFC